jgi:hypothetical protein
VAAPCSRSRVVVNIGVGEVLETLNDEDLACEQLDGQHGDDVRQTDYAFLVLAGVGYGAIVLQGTDLGFVIPLLGGENEIDALDDGELVVYAWWPFALPPRFQGMLQSNDALLQSGHIQGFEKVAGQVADGPGALEAVLQLEGVVLIAAMACPSKAATSAMVASWTGSACSTGPM